MVREFLPCVTHPHILTTVEKVGNRPTGRKPVVSKIQGLTVPNCESRSVHLPLTSLLSDKRPMVVGIRKKAVFLGFE